MLRVLCAHGGVGFALGQAGSATAVVRNSVRLRHNGKVTSLRIPGTSSKTVSKPAFPCAEREGFPMRDLRAAIRTHWSKMRPDLGRDVVAGLTAAAVVLPKAIAFAAVAGLPVAVGLYTAFVPAVIYGLLGSSRVLSVSSTTTLAILTGAELGSVAADGGPASAA